MAKGRKTGGRKKGSVNEITRALGEMIDGALHELGGQEWLVATARDEPVAFLTLLGKRLPKALEHSGSIGTELTREQMIERLAALHARAAKPPDQR